MTLPLPQPFIDEMIAHAQEDSPNECCGIIAGEDGRAVKVFRAKNSEASPYRYNVDPKDLFRIFRECDDNGWGFLAIYHSHTASEAYPSPTDVRMASEDVPYIIVSFAQEPASIRAFRIVKENWTDEEGEIREIPVVVER